MHKFVRVKEAAQVRFGQDAENLGTRSELAECMRMKQAACAVATWRDVMELEEEEDGKAFPDDSSTSSDQSRRIDF